MTDRVLIPTPAGWLALSEAEFRKGLEAGAAFAAAPVSSPAATAQSNLLSAEQLAERFSIPRSTVYELRKAGKLEAVRCGRLLRFDPDKALAALSRRT